MKRITKFIIAVLFLLISMVSIFIAKKCGQQYIVLGGIVIAVVSFLIITFTLVDIISLRAYEKYKMDKPYGFDVYTYRGAD